MFGTQSQSPSVPRQPHPSSASRATPTAAFHRTMPTSTGLADGFVQSCPPNSQRAKRTTQPGPRTASTGSTTARSVYADGVPRRRSGPAPTVAGSRQGGPLAGRPVPGPPAQISFATRRRPVAVCPERMARTTRCCSLVGLDRASARPRSTGWSPLGDAPGPSMAGSAVALSRPGLSPAASCIAPRSSKSRRAGGI